MSSIKNWYKFEGDIIEADPGIGGDLQEAHRAKKSLVIPAQEGNKSKGHKDSGRTEIKDIWLQQLDV